MVRRIMSDAENERQKQRIRSFLHNGRRIEDAYPQIEKIEINYLKEHNSFVGHNEKDGKWTLTPHSEMYFVIECLNRECTSIGYLYLGTCFLHNGDYLRILGLHDYYEDYRERKVVVDNLV